MKIVIISFVQFKLLSENNSFLLHSDEYAHRHTIMCKNNTTEMKWQNTSSSIYLIKENNKKYKIQSVPKLYKTHLFFSIFLLLLFSYEMKG